MRNVIPIQPRDEAVGVVSAPSVQGLKKEAIGASLIAASLRTGAN